MANNSIKNVLVLGATGNIGHPLTSALAATGYTVTAASRSDPSTAFLSVADSSSITPATVDYTSPSSLLTLFTGQDAIITALPPTNDLPDLQSRIVNAAIQSGSVKHIITPEFAGDTFCDGVARRSELPLYEAKVRAQRVLEETLKEKDPGGRISWSAIITGPWFDWAIPQGYYWINPITNTLTVYGSGTQRVSISSIPTICRSVCTILANPSTYANRPVYVADYTASMAELVPILEGMRPGWTVERVEDLDAFYQEAMRLWNEDTAKGVEVRLSTKAYVMLGTYGIFAEGNQFNSDYERLVEKEALGIHLGRIEDLKRELEALVLREDGQK